MAGVGHVGVDLGVAFRLASDRIVAIKCSSSLLPCPLPPPTPKPREGFINSIGKGGEKSTYTTMGTISTTALLGRLVDLDMLHDQVAGVEAFGIGVRFRVFEQAEEEFGGLLGPAGAGDAELFAWIYRSC